INDAGVIASKINAAGPSGQDGIWFNGQLAYTADQVIGNIWLNNNSYMTFTHGVAGAMDLHYLNPSTSSSGALTTGPAGAVNLTSQNVNDHGQVGMTAQLSNGSREYVSYDASNSGTMIHAADAGADASSPYCL